MASSSEIRAGLEAAARKRQEAADLMAEGTDELRKLYRVVVKAEQSESEKPISMAEAARLGKVSRPTAYAMAKEATD